MATGREEADRFLSSLEVSYDRTRQRRNDNDDKTPHNVLEAPLVPTVDDLRPDDRYQDDRYQDDHYPDNYQDYEDHRCQDDRYADDRYHRSHVTMPTRSRATSITDHHDSRPKRTYQDFLRGDTIVKQHELESRRGRGRSKSRSPVRDYYRPRREASWDHEWIHDRYRHRDAGPPRHGKTSGSELNRSQSRQEILPNAKVYTSGNPQTTRQMFGKVGAPSTHARDNKMSRHQEPIKLTEDKRKTTKRAHFSDGSHNPDCFVAHKLPVDTDEKAKLTSFKKTGVANCNFRYRGQDRAIYNASFKPIKQPQLFDAESEPQIGSEPICGIESHSQDEFAEYEFTARPTEKPEATVARLQRVLIKMHADVTKLKSRDNLFTLINHRRKLWLNETDLQIGLEEKNMRDATALQVNTQLDKLRKPWSISYSQQCINIRKEIRANMERRIIETIGMVIEMPKLHFLSNTASDKIMHILDREKALMVRDMEQRVASKKRALETEMQAFSDQEKGKKVREMLGRGGFPAQKFI